MIITIKKRATKEEVEKQLAKLKKIKRKLGWENILENSQLKEMQLKSQENWELNGTKYLVDTNFIIQLTQQKYWVEPFLDVKINISIITEMELLGVFSISKGHKSNMKSLLNDCRIIELNQQIKYLAIELKQKFKLKLADAIIAATAIHLELPFITSDGVFKANNKLELIFLEK